MAEAAIDPTSNPADAIQYDENGVPITDVEKPSNIDEETKIAMEKVWSVFATSLEDKVEIKELKTIMRALDVNLVTPEDYEEVRVLIDPDNTGEMTF